METLYSRYCLDADPLVDIQKKQIPQLDKLSTDQNDEMRFYIKQMMMMFFTESQCYQTKERIKCVAYVLHSFTRILLETLERVPIFSETSIKFLQPQKKNERKTNLVDTSQKPATFLIEKTLSL
jgi:hypothetical protein